MYFLRRRKISVIPQQVLVACLGVEQCVYTSITAVPLKPTGATVAQV